MTTLSALACVALGIAIGAGVATVICVIVIAYGRLKG